MNRFSKYLILFFALTCNLHVQANSITRIHPGVDTAFINLPAANYPVQQEALPVFSTSVKIGKVPPHAQYQVSLEYPEYEVLKSSEIKELKKLKDQIHTAIQINTHLGYSRKVGYLDIDFCPIVKQNGTYKRLVSCKINVKSSTTAPNWVQVKEKETTPLRWSEKSVLAEGKWAKLRVKNEGIYQLTPAFLAKMGFNDPSKVKLYGYGGRIMEEAWTFDNERQVPNDLNEVPLYRKSDGNALFFAEGTIRWTYNASKKKWFHENNPYSKYSYYFITEGENPAKMETLKAEKSPAGKVSQINHYALLDHDAFGWYEGGREMYDDYDFAYGPSHTFKVMAPSHDPDTNKADVDISFSASSPATATSVTFAHNGKTIGMMSIPKFGDFQSAYEVRKYFKSTTSEVENLFKISVSPTNPAHLNFIRMNYVRNLSAADAPFAFSPSSTQPVELVIPSAKEDTRLWRIGSGMKPTCEIASTLTGSTMNAIVDEGKERYVIVNLNEKYPTPEWEGKVENQNLHGDTQAYDMVILIPESRKLAGEAERLAEVHRKLQGLRVKVVDAGEIFNEFSSGTPDATAYRRYMKMLYDRAQTEDDIPRYLLLFGDCAWDNRMISSKWSKYSPKDFLLSFEVTDGFKNVGNSTFPLGEQNSYVTDDYFGWLDDNEGGDYTMNKIDLGIGRFTCYDAETAKILVDKCIDYLSNHRTGAWKNTIYILADDGNGNLHMNDAEVVVKQVETSTNHSAVIKKVYNDAYTRESTGTGHSFPTVTRLLKDAMNQGALIFNYTGHGSPDQLSHSKILKTIDFEAPSAGNLPLWIMASCEISPYDSQTHDLGRAALLNTQGGAISVMCASRSVYSNYNRILNIAYNKHLFDFDKNGKRNTMGDALRLTKVELVTPNEFNVVKDGSINKLKYVLLGNPAIPLIAPTGKVLVDSINGQQLAPADKIQFKAGSLVRFSGHVSDADGSPLHDFSGSVTATMADRLENITCKNNDGSAEDPMVFTDRTKKIFEGSDSIRNGKFSITFRIPRDISYSNDGGRITFYAVNNQKDIECHGANEQFFLNGTDASYAPDTLAPKVFLYLNDPEFPNGGITSPDPVFFAKIEDDAGINATGIGIGHDLELVIDNDQSNPIKLNENFNYSFGSYREGMVSFPLNGLEYGKHTLSFRVWDVNGNSTTQRLDFHIQDHMSNGFDVYASENPARTTTNFVTTFDCEKDETYTVNFEVFDLSGQKIWKSQNITLAPGTGYGICPWNLTNGVGARIPAGIYLYKANIKSENNKKETKAKKIIVLEQ